MMEGVMGKFNDKIDFEKVKRVARGYEEVLLRRILPHAVKQGFEYIAINPTRYDRNLGSFRINARTLKWADFSTGDRGDDIITLWAYVRQLSQLKAAEEIMEIARAQEACDCETNILRSAKEKET
jgi:putative DNA primase/helicase